MTYSLPGGELSWLIDQYRCDRCKNIYKTTNGVKVGAVFFNIDNAAHITEMLVLCFDCRVHQVDTKQYKRFRMLTPLAMMDLITDYDMSYEQAHRLMLVDGKINRYATYGFLTKGTIK
jgi:hypothetical protein